MCASRSGKTLTLNKPSPRDDDNGQPTSRSGSRAHRAAIRVREERKEQRQKQRRKQHHQSRSTVEQSRQPRHYDRPDPTRVRAPRRQETDQTTTTHRDLAEVFTAYAPCPRGLETALADELTALGFERVKRGRAGCRFQTDWAGIMRANLYSRLATRILMQVARAPVQHEDDILELARKTPWERWFGPEHTLRVDTSAVGSPMQSLQYCNLRAKDGVCDRLREREGSRPNIDTTRPDARVHLFLDRTTATLYLDTSGESLFKRGWRLDKGQAPLRENLAAGLLQLANWQPDTPLLDPFCGSGTILVEAAWMAMGMPAGINRPFAFQRMRDHDRQAWQDMVETSRAKAKQEPETVLAGSDTDAASIRAARDNLRRAGLPADAIQFDCADARTVMPPTEQPGLIVTNPPYGERLEDAGTLWQEWASHLKQHYNGWHVYVISSNHDLPGQMRLRPDNKYPLYNGALDCRFFSFEMVSGSNRR